MKNKDNVNISVGRLLMTLFMLVIVILGGTFAWFSYQSRQSSLVLTVGDINDTQIKLSPYHIKGTMTPVNTYTSGVYSEVEVANGGKSTSIALYYKINELDKELIDNGLAYTIVDTSTGNTVKNGYFSDLIDTTKELPSEVVILDENTVVGSTSNYKVYLWLDSSVGNQTEVQNSTLDVELNGSIGSVKISGTNTYGQTLTAIVIDSSSTASYTYQWYSNTTNSTTGGTQLTEATSSNTYTIGSGLAGKYIYVVATAIEDYYSGRTYTDLTDVENNTTEVVDRKNATLTVNPKTLNLTYPNADSTTISYTYDGDGTVSCSSADTSIVTCSVDESTKKVTVTPKSANASTTITLSATQGTNYNATTSANVAVNVTMGTMTAGVVTISGTNTYGQTLTATVTTDTSPKADTYKYQWYSNSTNSTSGGTLISGATSSTYTIGSGLVEKYIYVVVTAEKTDYSSVTFSDITDEINNNTPVVSRASCVCTISTVPNLIYPESITGNIEYECTGDGDRSVISETTSVITVGTIGTTSTELTAKGSGTSTIMVSQDAGTNYNACTSDSEDVTVSASTYEITYDYSTNGGTSATKTSATVAYGDNIDLSVTATKSGWTFVGWNTDKDATSKLNSITMGTGNVTLYAIYKKEAITYTATTQKNVSSATGTDTSVSCTIDEVYNTDTQATSCSVTLPANPYTLSDWTFNGWVNVGNTTTTTTPITSGTAVGNTITLSSNVNIIATWVATDTATFYYYNGNKAATTTVQCSRYNGGTCRYNPPLDLIPRDGPSSTIYVGVSTSINSTTTTASYPNTTKTYYAVYSATITSTFYYNSNTNPGGLTVSTATATGTRTSTFNGTDYVVFNGSISVPDEVSGSVGQYNSAYKSVYNSTTNMSSISPTTAYTTYYANYSSPVTIYRPSSTSVCSASTTAYYRNEWFTSTTEMSQTISLSRISTADITTVNGILDNFKGLAISSSSLSVLDVKTAAASSSTTLYAISTTSVTATFYYQSSTTAGTCSVTSTTASGDRTNYCTSTTTASTSAGSITVPDEVSGSVGKYNSAYKSVYSSASSMSSRSPTTAYTTYYANYSSAVTIYRPSSTSARTSQTVYRNEWLTSTTTCGTPVLGSSKTTTSNTSVTQVSGWTFYGLATATNTKTRNYSTMSAAASSSYTTLYSISYKTITISYDVNGGTGTVSDSTGTGYLYTTSSGATTSGASISISSTKPTRTGYTFLGWSTSSTATSASYTSGSSYTFTADDTLYAVWTVYTLGFNFYYNHTYASGEYLDTNYKLDWDRDFKITLTFKIPTAGKRYLIIGGYNNSDTNALNIETTTGNALRVYFGTGQVNKSSGTITAGENVAMEFNWDAETDTYTITATGTNTNISFSGTYSMSGKATTALRVGTLDNRDSSVFSASIYVKSVSIYRPQTAGTTLSDLHTPTLNGYVFSGWYTATSGGTQITKTSTMPSSNVTYYGRWIEKVYQIYNSSGTSIGYANSLTNAIGTTNAYTVKALKDNSDGEVTISKPIILNTNGKTIDVTTISNTNTLTITGNGALKSIDKTLISNKTNATLYIYGGTFSAVGYCIDGWGNSTTTIGGDSQAYAIYMNCDSGVLFNNGTMTVKPGIGLSVYLEAASNKVAVTNQGTMELGLGSGKDGAADDVYHLVYIASTSGYAVSNKSGTLTYGLNTYSYTGGSYTAYNNGTFYLKGGRLYYSGSSGSAFNGSKTATGTWTTVTSSGTYNGIKISDINYSAYSYRVS